MKKINMLMIENIRKLERKTGRLILFKLVKLYAETTPEIVRQLQEFSKKSQYVELACAAHTLKSSSANLGVELITSSSAKIEELIVNNREFSTEEIENLVEVIAGATTDAIAELVALVKDDGGSS